MSSSYDGDNDRTVTTETYESAGKIGLKPLRFVCLRERTRPWDRAGDHSIVFAHFLPRAGERIETEEGRICRVESVIHKLVQLPDSDIISFMPIVVAEPIANPPGLVTSDRHPGADGAS
ncbi:hypothetical protein [Singulisphaera sp. PoT]|uniref:hypothetical protein n=1 Tax=Singulisphaera sp. PoT TaxID=3411797 RepID=UPI003BF5EFE9